MGTSSSPGFISVEQAAQHLSITSQTVRRLIKTGEIEAYKVGRSIRIPVTALETPGVKAGGTR